MANLNIRVDDTLKQQAEQIFSDIGISLSAATTIFLKQVVRYNGTVGGQRAHGTNGGYRS